MFPSSVPPSVCLDMRSLSDRALLWRGGGCCYEQTSPNGILQKVWDSITFLSVLKWHIIPLKECCYRRHIWWLLYICCLFLQDCAVWLPGRLQRLLWEQRQCTHTIGCKARDDVRSNNYIYICKSPQLKSSQSTVQNETTFNTIAFHFRFWHQLFPLSAFHCCKVAPDWTCHVSLPKHFKKCTWLRPYIIIVVL